MVQAGRSLVRFPARSLQFLVTYSFQRYYAPGVDSTVTENTSNLLSLSRECYVSLKLHRHLCADNLEIVEASTSQNTLGVHGLLGGKLHCSFTSKIKH
jgi:hypothetical protein